MSIGGFEGWYDWCHVDPTEPDDDSYLDEPEDDDDDDDDDNAQVPIDYDDDDDDDDVFVHGVKA